MSAHTKVIVSRGVLTFDEQEFDAIFTQRVTADVYQQLKRGIAILSGFAPWAAVFFHCCDLILYINKKQKKLL